MDKDIDFSRVTACGECCDECSKHRNGVCPGCIEADGFVPGWSESGRCRVHTCTREHDVQFCGLCREFPCSGIEKMMPWHVGIVEHMRRLADAYRRECGET